MSGQHWVVCALLIAQVLVRKANPSLLEIKSKEQRLQHRITQDRHVKSRGTLHASPAVTWTLLDGAVVHVSTRDVEDMLRSGELEAKVWKVVGHGAEEGIGIGETWVGLHSGDGEPVHGGEDVGHEHESGARVNSGGELIVPPDFLASCP